MKKYTLIIGSGIHNQGLSKISKEYSSLRSWEALMTSLNISSSPSPLLGFEKAIFEHAKKNNFAAHVSENKLLSLMAHNLKVIQNKVINETDLKYPLEIFNNEKVGDVIVLNFDLIIEILLIKKFKTKGIQVKKTKACKLRYRLIEGMNFWHPHGDIYCPSEIQFGLRNYGKGIKSVEILRNFYKKFEKEPNIEEKEIERSWYSALLDNPLIFIGTGMTMDEWTLWYALTTRQRNFARNGVTQPVYTLLKDDSHERLRSFLEVKSISDSNCYDNAWKDLIYFLK